MTSFDNARAVAGPLTGFLLGLLGNRYRGLERTQTGLVLQARKPRHVAFSEMTGPLHVARKFGVTSVCLHLADGSAVTVPGLNSTGLVPFVAATNNAWHRAISEQFEAAKPEIEALAEVVRRLDAPRRYPAACRLQPFIQRAQVLADRLPKADPAAFLSVDQQDNLSLVLDLQNNAHTRRATAIEVFVAAELAEMKPFFDAIERHPLTPEQRCAVVTDEDATLVLAGAGSGKTSVIVAKAAYLLQRGIRRPEEILLLAFGREAAEEMAARIEERCGAPIHATTFHALGYAIIRDVEGQAPALASHASDEATFRAIIRDILMNDIASQAGHRALLVKWFSEFFWPYKDEWNFKSTDEYYQYVEAHELRTLQGELVRSFEEWEIANWLYLNGIAYEYEPLYEHRLPENKRRAYTPDFRLTESGVYIEHFGVRQERGPDGVLRLTTAPYVDRESYLEGMAWKRQIHKDYGTTLIETYSYERGRLTQALEDKLAPYAAPNPIPSNRIFDALSKLGHIDAFTQTLGTFLRHFKSGRLTIDRCRQRARSSVDHPRNLAFLKIFEPFLEAYQRRLGDRIDFEDMIARATDHVQTCRYRSPYRHLLVDEFQDLSSGRAELLLALKAQQPDAHIFAVGDDWQSIYRFAGADIHLMRNFGSLFGGNLAGQSGVHSTVDLGRTFRSVDKIALPARSFVLKNPLQIAKRTIPAGVTTAPAIKVAYTTRSQEGATLRTVLEGIKTSSAAGCTTSVLLLGRYHFVCPENLVELEKQLPELSIRFMTVHASKGLEADHVIILSAVAGRLGFPSEVTDDPLLDLVLPQPEPFDHAEERRLFYVALTRARKSVTLLAERNRPSVFVRELIANQDYEAIEVDGSGVVDHRCRTCGGRMLRQTAPKGRVHFACEHRYLCGETSPSCSNCLSGIPIRFGANSETLVCSCGARFRDCPDCKDGWLVVREGPSGKFLGCAKYPLCKGSRPLSDQITKPLPRR